MKDFDFLGITIQYEMCYTNILQILDLAQIPLLREDQGLGCSGRDRRRSLYLQPGAVGGFF